MRAFDPSEPPSRFSAVIDSCYPLTDARRGLRRHFVAAADGRVEQIDDIERERGRLTVFEIESLASAH